MNLFSLLRSILFKSSVNPALIEETVSVGSEAPWELEQYEHPYEIPGQRDVRAIYGHCGESKISKKWKKKNLVTVKGLPGHFNRWHKLNKPGDCRLYEVHYKMVPALIEALSRCDDYGVIGEIDRIGVFKWRKMRTSQRLSMHSWAIALDINPQNNKLRRFKRGEAPEPFSDEWRATWPSGLSESIARAFEEAGFLWGGRWETTPDPMHFQLTK